MACTSPVVQAAVLGFVGSPWTLATYIIEGKSSALYKTIKTMLYKAPGVLEALLGHLADQIAAYSCFQIASGAQAVQLFDSWGGQLPPQVHALSSAPKTSCTRCALLLLRHVPSACRPPCCYVCHALCWQSVQYPRRAEGA